MSKDIRKDFLNEEEALDMLCKAKTSSAKQFATDLLAATMGSMNAAKEKYPELFI